MPKKKEKIVLVGGGGHSKVVIDALRDSKEFSVYGIADPNLSPRSSVSNVRVIGSDDMLFEIFKKGVKYAFISIASIGNCDIRKRRYARLKSIGFRLPVIVHPRAFIGENVKFEEGVFVAAGAVIAPDVKIGKNAIVNTSSSIDHDCVIGDFVHVSPGVTLCGGVIVGDEAHIGAGACVIQNIRITKGQFVSAGKLVKEGQ